MSPRPLHVMWFALTLLFLSSLATAQAQSVRPILGTEFYTVLLPDGTRRLGQKKGVSIDFVSEANAIKNLQKRILADKRLIQGLNKRLMGLSFKLPKSKLFKSLRKFGDTVSKSVSQEERRKISAVKRKLNTRRKLNLRTKKAIEAFIVDGILPQLSTFTGELLHKYQRNGQDRFFYAIFVGIQLPSKFSSVKSAPVCASYSGNSEEPHRGAMAPLEAETTLDNDPCILSITPDLANCPGAFGVGVLGFVLASTFGDGSAPSSSQKQTVLALAGANDHFMRLKTKGVKCRLK